MVRDCAHVRNIKYEKGLEFTVSVSQTHGIDISRAPVVRLGGLASAHPTMYMYILSRSIYCYGQQGITTCILQHF